MLANLLLLLVGTAADCFKLLYPWQLKRYPSLQKKRAAVFHDFVPVSTIVPTPGERYILLVGYPWYTKGVDILIRAFRLIASQFPEYKLKLMGFYPDRRHLDELAGGCSQIEFVPAAPNEVALKVIGNCSVYVSASRTEGMARVLQEAMAAGKPIIASAVGGTPHCILHNDNGILVEPGNVNELAEKLAQVLSNPELCKRLAARAHGRVFSQFDERAYVRSFRAMLEEVLSGLE
jgi:glycosyltransferase involved in cell wall biosynthesis